MFSFADGAFRGLSWLGVAPEFAQFLQEPRVWGPETGLGQLVMTKNAVHVNDARKGRAYADRDPDRMAAVNLGECPKMPPDSSMGRPPGKEISYGTWAAVALAGIFIIGMAYATIASLMVVVSSSDPITMTAPAPDAPHATINKPK